MILKEIYVAWLVDKNREKMKRVLKRIHKNPEGSRVVPLESRNAYCLANSISIWSDERERNELHAVHRMGRKGKVIWNGGWLINVLLCDSFFDCTPVLTKSVAEMTLILAYVFNVAFVALYHINEIERRASDVILYVSLFVGRENYEGGGWDFRFCRSGQYSGSVFRFSH